MGKQAERKARKPLGVLMLDTRFPRIPGDIGNPLTWSFPVIYQAVKTATPQAIVKQDAEAMAAAFVAAAKDLERQGVAGITTGCGFLSLIQGQLKAAVGVPVAASPLMQVPWVQSLLPAGKRVGVLTIDRNSLGKKHLAAAGAAPCTPVWGTETGVEFSKAILGNEPALDRPAACRDLLNAAHDFKDAQPDLGALVLECTNMAPYAQEIGESLNVPVYSVYSFLNWFYQGLSHPGF